MKELKNIPANGKESYYYKFLLSLIWNKRKPEFLAGIAHLFLILTYQMSWVFYPQAWFISVPSSYRNVSQMVLLYF